MNDAYLRRLKAAVDRVEDTFEKVFYDDHPEPDRTDYPMRQQPRLHVPTLALKDFLASGAYPPPAVARTQPGYAWGMLLNDRLGDCGEAMSIHGDEAFHLDAGTPVPPYTDADAEAWYEIVGNYNPNAPLVNGVNPTDQGTDNDVLVQKWKNPGLLCKATGQYSKIVASLFIDPADKLVTQIGIWEFIAVFRATGLPITAQTQPVWRVSDDSLQGPAAVASWGYHDTPHIAYNRRGPITITWGAEKQETWDFDATYGVGGFVVVTEDQLNNEGVSPTGVNWTQLNAALADLPAAPVSS